MYRDPPERDQAETHYQQALTHLGDHEQAAHHYQASLAIRQEIGDRQGEGWMLHALARVYAAQGMDSEAHTYTTQASAAAAACTDSALQEACCLLQRQLKQGQ